MESGEELPPLFLLGAVRCLYLARHRAQPRIPVLKGSQGKDAPCSPFNKPPAAGAGGRYTNRRDGMDNELRVCRARQDITQGQLAEAVGVSRQTIISIENGRYDPSLDLAFKLSRYFGMDIEEIFHYKEE